MKELKHWLKAFGVVAILATIVVPLWHLAGIAAVSVEAEERSPTPPDKWIIRVDDGRYFEATNFANAQSFCEFDTTNGTHVVTCGNWTAERRK